jgi:hypothetical protein
MKANADNLMSTVWNQSLYMIAIFVKKRMCTNTCNWHGWCRGDSVQASVGDQKEGACQVIQIKSVQG